MGHPSNVILFLCSKQNLKELLNVLSSELVKKIVSRREIKPKVSQQMGDYQISSYNHHRWRRIGRPKKDLSSAAEGGVMICRKNGSAEGWKKCPT